MKSVAYTKNYSFSLIPAAVLPLLLVLAIAVPALADVPYLKPGEVNGAALLPPPPASGSAEAAADLAEVRSAFKARTKAETDKALKDESLSFSLFQPAIGPSFDLANLPKTQAFLMKMRKDIQVAIDQPKNFYKRQRPYQIDPELKVGHPERSYGYPSGHSARGTVYALILSELYPDKRDALLPIGTQIGWDRVLIGKHFFTDVYAGRVLGYAIFRELLTSKQFRQDMAEAKKEITEAASTVPAVLDLAK
jgi:acid phosphatase (class A)